MKTNHLLILAVIVTACGLTSCERKKATLSEKVGEEMNDALDRRPNEKLKDAVEDVEKDVKKAAGEAGDAIKDSADKVKDAPH